MGCGAGDGCGDGGNDVVYNSGEWVLGVWVMVGMVVVILGKG